MSSISNCQFYCLSFNNEERKSKMSNRFTKFDIDCKFFYGIQYDDERFVDTNYKREWCMTLGHLDIINDFYYNSNKRFAVICEDDIYLHINFKNIFNKVLCDFYILNLDVLLLGYLLPYKLGKEELFTNFKLKKSMPKDSYFKYHDYPETLNGTHMYMITKKYAKHLLDNYYNHYSIINDKYFTPDKILIKDGNRALIYPMLAIEEPEQKDLYHQLCHNIHYTDLYS